MYRSTFQENSKKEVTGRLWQHVLPMHRHLSIIDRSVTAGADPELLLGGGANP